MRKRGCIGEIANALAFRRSLRFILCLLLVLSGTLNVGHYSHAHAYEASLQLISTDNGADPCSHDDASLSQHCHLTSICPFCAPIVAYEQITKSGSVFSSVNSDALVPGHVIAPHLRPPSFLLQI